MQKTTNEQDLLKKLRELETINKHLTEERHLLRALIDNYPDSIYAKDASGRKILANKANFKNLGFESETEVLGKTDFDLFSQEVAAKLFEDDQLVLQKGQSLIDHEEKLVTSDGKVFWMLTKKIPWRDMAGNIIGIIGGGRNVTKQKEAELKLLEERNLLRTLIDNLPDAIYAKDADARKILANPADLRNLGCGSEAEAFGKNDFDFFPKEVAERLFEHDQLVLKKGHSLINREEKVVTSSGEIHWLLTTKVPWRDADGKIIGLVGIGHDITKQKETEVKLMAERNLLRTVIENLPDAIYVKDAAARKALVNPADLKNLGYKTEAEALGKNDFDFFPKEIAEKLFQDDQLVLQKGQSLINREEKVVTSSGEIHWLLTTKVPWRDADGKIIGLVGIGRDITDKKNLEMQLLRAQRMESIGRLATGIAHDLNNILAPILISSALLREKVNDEEGLNMLATVEASAKRGAEVVKQVLAFGRGVEGKKIPINLKHFVKDVTRIAAETFNRSIQIETHIASDIWTVAGDPMNLHQTLLNLCFNARDAMPSGGKLTVAVRNFKADADFVVTHVDAHAGRYVILEITDTGRGIARENLDRIFEPFFTSKELGKGAGLGLSTVLSTAKSHGGFILVESEVDKGSTFQIYLPAQPEQNPEREKL
ncbi:MAG: PAS domain-containing protein [Verrucomicrobiota bacterium]